MDNLFSNLFSLIAILFTGLTYYRDYIFKKQCVQMTVGESKVDDRVLSISVVFNNLGNKIVTITNCYIQLDDHKFGFNSSNYKASHIWITPFSLPAGNQKSIIISYNLTNSYEKVIARINVNSIDSNGVKDSDRFEIGHLYSNDKIHNILHISYFAHQLFTNKCVSSIHK